MSTIPVPNIVEGAQQVANAPMNALASQTELQGMQQQQNERSLNMQMQRRQMADQDALTKAMSQYDPSKHSLADFGKLVTQNGGSGQAALNAQSGLVAQKQKYLELSDAQFAHEQKLADLTQGVHDQVAGAPPEDKQNVYSQGLMTLARAGADVSKESPMYPGDQEFEKHLAPIRLHTAILAESNKERELQATEDKANAEQSQAQSKAAEVEQKNWEKFPELGMLYNTKTGEQKSVGGAYLPPGMLEGKYVSLLQKKNSGQSLAPEDSAFVKSYEHMKSLVPIANFNLQNSGASADSGGNPSEIAKAIAGGQMAWKDAVSMRTPMSVKNGILKQVFQINPSFDTAEFGLETDAAKKARSGAWADTRVAYNTAIDHSKQLMDAVDALNSGDVKRLNSMKNFFKTEFGSPDVPTYQAIANAYNHEVTSVVSKNHITDAEVKAGGGVLGDNASPQALRGVVSAYNKLMMSKRDELDKIIKAGAGNKADAVLKVGSSSEGGGSQGSQGQTRSYQGRTYAKQPDGSWKLAQ